MTGGNMGVFINIDKWSTLSPAEKKLELFRRQKDLLDTFLSTGAIKVRLSTIKA